MYARERERDTDRERERTGQNNALCSSETGKVHVLQSYQHKTEERERGNDKLSIANIKYIWLCHTNCATSFETI